MGIEPTTAARIAGLRDDAERLFADGNHRDAVELFATALALLPPPLEEHRDATEILAAIADGEFAQRRWAESSAAGRQALRCPGGVDECFIWLRIGQALFELGDNEGAGDALASAYMLCGRELFDDEDPKYFGFLTSVLEPPSSGVW